ncbi:hypothetical protein E2553_00200 [Paraburkholderia dipogonis]|uniref:Uncharacterized protein n=1 Tax=Paraburkholderia dipogonis TaxID=1211383 RepID=A0A4Y8N1T1_9BURK|nr:hypothetical protein E2553_00200 [Paraburkholderia dipogonis]
MLRAWDHTKLRVDGWTTDTPDMDDEIVTTTGRRYRILDAIWRNGRVRHLVVVVLPPDAAVIGRQFSWCWTPRSKRASPG